MKNNSTSGIFIYHEFSQIKKMYTGWYTDFAIWKAKISLQYYSKRLGRLVEEDSRSRDNVNGEVMNARLIVMIIKTCI